MENENRVTGRSKIPKNAKMWIFGRQGIHMVVGRPSNLVHGTYRFFLISLIFVLFCCILADVINVNLEIKIKFYTEK